MKTFTKEIENSSLPEEMTPVKVEEPIIKWNQVHTLYVIPLFIDSNEVAMVAHSPKKWDTKIGEAWLTYMSGEYDDAVFSWERLKGILEKYGFSLNRTIKYDCMSPLYKSPSERGTITVCVLYIDQYDYDENDMDRPTSYRIKKAALQSGEIKFPDTSSVVATQYLLNI